MRYGFLVFIVSLTLPSFLSRSVAGEVPSPALVRVLGVLENVKDPAIQRDVLHGIQEAFSGRRRVAMPPAWPEVYRMLAASPDGEVRMRARFLAVVFGDPQAIRALRDQVVNASDSAEARKDALQTLLYTRDQDLVPLLQKLLGDSALRGMAIRGLAAFADEATPRLLIEAYGSMSEEEKNDVIQTLVSRPGYALELLDAVEKQRVPRRDLSAFAARQMLALKNPQINDRLTKVWGSIRPASQDKAARMAEYKALLTPDYLKSADPAHGRAIFTRTCAACHKLFDAGGNVGPELTGSQRSNLDYVLENVLDPSAIVPQDYQMTIVETKDGRILNGIIKQETDKTLTVRTQNDTIIVAKSEIESRQRSPQSMMPENLFGSLNKEEVRDLVAYLASPGQVGGK